MKRAVVINAETTGLSPQHGDRIIELGAVELENLQPTGRVFHSLINPRRDVPEEATAVHGIGSEHLKDAPLFGEILNGILAFLGGDPLIVRPVRFTQGFFDAELRRLGRRPLNQARFIDVSALARARFPGQSNHFDALCQRLGVDVSARTSHDILRDCRLLAEVYKVLTTAGERYAGHDGTSDEF
jgi:DNA polymerase-3 subunit epsilon